LREIIDHYKNDDKVAAVAIQTTFEGFSTNNFDSLKKVAKQYDLTIPIGQNGWQGRSSPIMYRYRTRGTPWVIIIDSRGMLRRSNFHYPPAKSIRIIDKLKKEIK